MDEQEAEALGRQARTKGQPAGTIFSPEISAELEGARMGEKTHLMEAYSRGWNNEHRRITDHLLRDKGIF